MLRKKAKFKGLIISFEPIPNAVSTLQKLSVKDPLWIIEESALSNINGEQAFNIMSNSQFSSLSKPYCDEVSLFNNMNKINKTIKVKAETLDNAYARLKNIYQFKRPFIKLDTQGYDVEIVRNGQSVIKNFVGLQSELSINKLYTDSIKFKEAITFYEKCGFKLSAFVPNNAGHFPRLVEIDCIMVRDDLL
jgi:FkbM family methyltransferase